MNIKNNRTLLIISAVAIIMFLIVFFSNVFEVREYERAPRCKMNASDSFSMNFSMNDTFRNAGSRNSIPLSYRLLISPALLMIAAVLATYYFISRRLEEKLEKNMAIISKLIDKNNNSNNSLSKESALKESTGKMDNAAVLKFFNSNERKILEELIEKNGSVLQSEISRMNGMNKLRTHRTLKDLERKGIIKTESHGKTNRVIMADDIKEILLKK
ncbi:MAG: winged helix-turn-helix transcriptional regulator [Nanoarchaeota archaeon]|nr:winged helix-turn-helix transcriptional regulator [Nanoarchaeota archaeon]MBU4299989.1 winged helix-turn-helix transcriptional regulator [Nanoarchaeota archaeon]MBU4451223.1 winged helix-turn-helix transcriptional regulator [Nanoarchaeota archaeon]MCG2724083.1 winged helix-turn-helix transcriptional regulator [archaeon]